MVLYNFKTMVVVPSSKEFIDIVLSKTQRKTPTVVHKGWQISRIRSFYMRKVKFTQENWSIKLTQILDDFPRLDEIHPFYADLINVLYSRDHYKLALGQINTARTLIENICKDYLKMLKFGDSLYRCKELKRAAMGRMCTVMKKMGPSLAYLEEVRRHLSRLPSIDPNTRTLMITGYPNVGKSSFINKVSRANVDVQDYPFTTKSLYIGHMDYKYMRWQVIDTPGILDHPLEERNTIEMQAITALAHLHSTVLYFIDISETCGYTIQQQVALYHSIKPLFANKPLLVVCNKIDLKSWEEVTQEDKNLIETVVKDRNVQLLFTSNATEAGLDVLKTTACDLLLQHRVERKLKGKRINDVINRIQVSYPVARDQKERKVCIPDSVMEMKKAKAEGLALPPRKTAREEEQANGGPGIFSFDDRRLFQLPEDWKYDVIPQIYNGKNIADFVDPDIEERLAELEREETELEAKFEAEGGFEGNEEDELDEEKKELVAKIRKKRKMIIARRLADKTNNKPVLPRRPNTHHVPTSEEAQQQLAERGLDPSKFADRARSRSRTKKRTRMEEDGDDDADASMEAAENPNKKMRSRSRNKSMSKRDPERARSLSTHPISIKDGSAYKNPQQKADAEVLAKKVQKRANRNTKAGESDRRVLSEKPRHLFSGKRGIGKTDRR
jgi:nucleolar GTP-binding protein